MSRASQNLLLLLVALCTGLMVLKGTYLHYVKPSLLPWLVTAAVVLMGLAITAIVRDLRSLGHASGETDGHSHHGGLAWLLLLPIALIAFVVPPPIGANGAAPEMAAANPRGQVFPPLPLGRAPNLSVPEVQMRAATDSTKSLEGRLITTTGFTITKGGRTDLGRVVIVCCAADAQLARIHLAGPAAETAAAYPNDTWLQVEGYVDLATATPATNFVPSMSVSTVRRIDKPANTYSY